MANKKKGILLREEVGFEPVIPKKKKKAGDKNGEENKKKN